MDTSTIMAIVTQSMAPTGLSTGSAVVPAGDLPTTSSSRTEPTEPVAPEHTMAPPCGVLQESVHSADQSVDEPSPPLQDGQQAPFMEFMCFGLTETLVQTLEAVLSEQPVAGSSAPSSELALLAALCGREPSSSKNTSSRLQSGPRPFDAVEAHASSSLDGPVISAGADTQSVEKAPEQEQWRQYKSIDKSRLFVVTESTYNSSINGKKWHRTDGRASNTAPHKRLGWSDGKKEFYTGMHPQIPIFIWRSLSESTKIDSRCILNCAFSEKVQDLVRLQIGREAPDLEVLKAEYLKAANVFVAGLPQRSTASGKQPAAPKPAPAARQAPAAGQAPAALHAPAALQAPAPTAQQAPAAGQAPVSLSDSDADSDVPFIRECGCGFERAFQLGDWARPQRRLRREHHRRSKRHLLKRWRKGEC